MKSRASVDPELHVIRTLVGAVAGRARQPLESARFNLFAAFEAGDPAQAKRWAKAVRASIMALEVDGVGADLRVLAIEALDEIEKGIDS